MSLLWTLWALFPFPEEKDIGKMQNLEQDQECEGDVEEGDVDADIDTGDLNPTETARNFFSHENGLNLLGDLLEKIDSRCRAEFIGQQNEIGNYEIFIVNGDQRFKSIYGYDQFQGLTLQHLCGPTTSVQTIQEIYLNISKREPCEHYINLYAASEEPISCFVFFRIYSSPFSSDSPPSNNCCGIMSIAASCIVGNLKYLSNFS